MNPHDDHAAHLGKCSMWRCLACKARIPRTERTAHIQACGPPPKKTNPICGRCRIAIPYARYAAQLEECCMWFCRACRTSMPRPERNRYSQMCGPPPTKECSKCRRSIPREDYTAHRKDCKKWHCRRCKRNWNCTKYLAMTKRKSSTTRVAR